MNSKRLSLLLALLLFALPAQAERPKIGLALSGGGAKGSAHIGVIELLEANNIPVDYIAGTSIGAYVGGLYALGYNVEEIRQIMFATDFDSGFFDAIDRDKLSYRKKRQHDKFNVGLELGYRDGEIRFPFGGVLYGQSMSAIFRRSVGNIPNFDSFDELPIPFHALATDLATSQVVVLDHGNLIKAMKASATVPGALVPTTIDGKILVDGGMSQNLPVREVRNMGADIVIAVDISSPLQTLEDINNAIAVLDQISSFLTIHNVRDDKALLNDDDFYLRPDVDRIGTSDFQNMEKAFDAGREAARGQLEGLRKHSLSNAEYLSYRQEKSKWLGELIEANKRPVTKIILANKTSYNEEFLLYTLGLETDVPINVEDMLAAVDRIYSLDTFERVDAYFEERDIGRVLVIEVVEKSWGPNYLEVGLGWEDDFTVDSNIDLDFAYTLGNITDNNGEWRNELGIGTDKLFRSELHLPLDRIQQFYQSTIYQFERKNLESFEENQVDATFESNANRLDFGLGYKLGVDGAIEAGILYERGSLSNEFVLGDDLRYKNPGLFLRFGYDTLDRLSFPSRGTRLTMSATRRDEELSGASDLGIREELKNTYRTTQYLLEWKGAISSGNHGVIAQANVSLLDSETDYSIHFVQLGGFLNLSGYHRDALVGNQSAFTSLQYQYNLGRSLFGLKNFPIYAGASIEAGNVWSASDSISYSELIGAGSFYISTDSKLGPIALAYGFSEDNNSAIYFYLGKNI